MRAPRIRHAFRTVATVCASFLLVSAFVIPLRYLGMTTGLLPVARAETALQAPSLAPASSAFSTMVEYSSEAAAASAPASAGRTSTRLDFEDAWLFRNPSSYNHGLATACAVLSAVCNAESHYYSGVEGAVPYAEHALWSLGFTDVRTESYALRSSILDELGALLTGAHDIAAYTLASKTVPHPDGGEPSTIVFVGIRGSYGIEWISNLNFACNRSEGGDHGGFAATEAEVERALARYLRDRGANPERTRILITGHSRGGAVANLLAARLDGLSGTPGQIVPAENVYAYTFAAPASTRSEERGSSLYDNVFNIVNTSDIVPQLPLAAWGYGRYGMTAALPSAPGAPDVDGKGALERMEEAFERNTGVAWAGNRDSLAALGAFADAVAQAVPTAEALASPAGIAGTAHAFLGTDAATAPASHLPDTYIAWMQAAHGEDMRFSRA